MGRLPLELNLEICRTVLDGLPMGLYLVDRNRQICYWNRAAETITGYLAQEVIGRFCHDNLLMHCDENKRELCRCGCPLAFTMRDGQPREALIALRHKQGQRVPVRVRAVPIRNESGSVIGSAEYFEERPFGEEAYRAYSNKPKIALDEVTGIADRGELLSGLESALENLTAMRTPFGVLAIDVDGVEDLRRVRGCQAVNAVLYAAAQTVSANLRPGDLAGRWQDARFVAIILCPTDDALVSCAKRLQHLVSMAGVPWWGDRLSVTISVGGAMAREGDAAESLIARAEGALQSSREECRLQMV